jgi:hypothetical protein
LHTDAQPKPGDDVAEIVTLPLNGINPDIVFNDDIRKGFKKFLEEEV